MATAKLNTCEIIDDVRKCRRVVSELLQQPMVAVDAEGVNMSRTGPVALIQVALETGHVYLFDVYRQGSPTPEMFSDGGLQELLESERVLKVMHGSAADAQALHFQYSVALNNVYDVQVAQQLLDEAKGRQLPQKRKLPEVCKLYLSDTSDLDDKDDVQVAWYMTDAEFWARRPFTTEMTNYACADVRLLIPELYNQQVSLVRGAGLEAEVQRRIQDEHKARWNNEVKEALHAREREKIHAVIRKIQDRTPPVTDLAALQDEDEITAIDHLRDKDLEEFSPEIRNLKLQHYRKSLMEIRESLAEDDVSPSAVKANYRYFLVSRLQNHADKSIQRESKDLLRRIENLGVQRIATKYREDTPLKHLRDEDRTMLSSLRPGKEKYHPVVLRLHWLVKEEYVGQQMERLRSDKEAFKRRYNPGLEKYLSFLCKADIVPSGLQAKAKQLFDMLEEAGCLQPRQQASRGRRPRRH